MKCNHIDYEQEDIRDDDGFVWVCCSYCGKKLEKWV